MSQAVLTREPEVDLQQRPKSRPWTGASRKRLALAGAALIGLAAASWYGNAWWTNGRFIESTDDAYIGGNITALAPHISGFVTEVLVADNQRVQAGQLLVRLGRRDFQAALDHASAVVDARLASLERLHAQFSQQQSTIRQHEADLSAKAAQLTFAAQDAARYDNLAQTSAGSRQDAQRSASQERVSRSAVTAAAASLDVDQQQLKVVEAQIAEAAADLAQSRSDLETARLNLGYTEIRAPIEGYVGNRAAQVGAFVNAGAYLVSVIPANGLWVDANFKEDQLTHMANGDAATVVADVLPGHEFHGHVASFAPGTGAVFSVIPAENATGNFTKIVQRVPVRVLLDPDDTALRMLRPGLSTMARVDTRVSAQPMVASNTADRR